MNTTKTFKAWFGDKEVTREEFVREWVETTYQYGHLFLANSDAPEKLVAFQNTIAELAGMEWDNSK
jgi:hypothetical protein